VDPNRLLENLNTAQAEAVTGSHAPLCIIAGAGSGKTRVLTRRIGYRVATEAADPRHILALTFTRKAARELTTRLAAMGFRDSIAAGTFHSIAYAQLQTRWSERGIRPPKLLDRKARFVGSFAPKDVNIFDLISEIEWAKARQIQPDEYEAKAAAAKRTPPLAPKLVATLYARYEEVKKQRRTIDFDDILGLAIRDMQDPTIAAAIRWRYRHFYVDEFQDVNPLQFALLNAWLGDRNDLCVVGDPNQAIYTWNGADADYLINFKQWFPASGTVRLAENYRSSPQILSAANAVLGAKDANPNPLRANRPDGPEPKVVEFTSDSAEAAGIARAIREAKAPQHPWSFQAVLVRTNAQTALISEALTKAQVPHRVRGGAGLLEQVEVRQALDQLVHHGGRFEAAVADFAEALGETNAAIGETEPAPSRDETSSLREDTEVSDRVLQRHANLEMLLRLAYDYQKIDPIPTAEAFYRWLIATVGSDSADHDAVDVTTFHAAKGLEWPIVHLAGLESGLVPIAHAKTLAARAEERRLFYVAITRAETQLHCSWAKERSFGQHVANRDPSPYLDQILLLNPPSETAANDQRVANIGARRPYKATAGLTSAGQSRSRPNKVPAGLSKDNEELFESLRTWRSIKAKAAGVPAYVVFPDTTLVAVANERPELPQELLALPGIGPVKAQRHGEALLRIVAEHA